MLEGDRSTEEGGTAPSPPQRSAPHRAARMVAVVVAAVVATIFDEAIFSTPIVLATRSHGAGTASAAFMVLYSVGGAVVALLIARSYDRRLSGGPGRIERWLTLSHDDRRVRWVRRLLDRGGAVAFVTSSVLLGPIVTTLLVRAVRRDQALPSIGVSSSVIWAVTFVATYAGIAGLVL